MRNWLRLVKSMRDEFIPLEILISNGIYESLPASNAAAMAGRLTTLVPSGSLNGTIFEP
ncbi:MAG: hypothetical protein LiPW39_247 [Parcubacteria group bacterium LiPW_39]|nr:MAG: hypothetical protein LiPW39_247 [Parcubacteria group bacterium LiPW_39]